MLINLGKEIYDIWLSEKPNQLAAALAYFGMFSFSAVIFLAYQLAGIFINEAAAAERFYSRLEAVLGSETAAFIQSSVAAVSTASTEGSWIISVVTFFSLLFAAMGLFLQLKYVLNRIWGVPLTIRGKKSVIIRQRLFAFLMVIALGLLIIIATLINVAFAWFGEIIKDYYGGSSLLAALNTVALLGAVVLAIAFVYKMLPDVKIRWRDVWAGATIATLLMAVGGLVMGIYFRVGGVHSAFQAAGAFAVLMITIYYFAQIFLFGAIITRVYAHRYGSMRNNLPESD